MNDKYWDELFSDLGALSDEEFSKILDELDKSPDIPFCIEDQPIYISIPIKDDSLSYTILKSTDDSYDDIDLWVA